MPIAQRATYSYRCRCPSLPRPLYMLTTKKRYVRELCKYLKKLYTLWRVLFVKYCHKLLRNIIVDEKNWHYIGTSRRLCGFWICWLFSRKERTINRLFQMIFTPFSSRSSYRHHHQNLQTRGLVTLSTMCMNILSVVRDAKGAEEDGICTLHLGEYF